MSTDDGASGFEEVIASVRRRAAEKRIAQTYNRPNSLEHDYGQMDHHLRPDAGPRKSCGDVSQSVGFRQRAWAHVRLAKCFAAELRVREHEATRGKVGNGH